MIIDKIATGKNKFQRKYIPFKNARTAFKAFLKALRFESGEQILIPAYIGWSSREGSGVFDPIKELGLSYSFYKIDDELHICIDDFKAAFKIGKIKVVVFIHYFGYVDSKYEELISFAKMNGAIILEDEAHAMFTDLIGGISGRLGDANIFSLHKLLPLDKGGLLVLNNSDFKYSGKFDYIDEDISLPWIFDLIKISQKRIQNAEFLLNSLSNLKGYIEPLRGNLKEGEIPQTLPVLVKNVSRDSLYFMMNDAGFGVVSLYHTLIEEISIEKYPRSFSLSSQILNLPLHQDIEQENLLNMVDKLCDIINTISRSIN